MDRETMIRAAITVVLCFAILMAFQYFMPAKRPAVAPATVTETPVSSGTDISPIDHIAAIAPGTSDRLISTQPLVVETPDFHIAFDPDTGHVMYVKMQAYHGESDESPMFVVGGNLPYASFVGGLASGFTHEILTDGDNTTVIFTGANDKVRVVKSFLMGKGYFIPMTFEITNLTDQVLSVPVSAAVGPGLGKGFGVGNYVYTGPIIHNQEKTEKKAAKDVKKTIMLEDPLWGGYTSKYFLFSVFADGFKKAEIVKNNGSASVVMTQELIINPGATAQIPDLAIYVGPKEYNTLKSFGNDLQKSIDYGVFFFLAIPMTKIMNFAYSYVRNYGIAIIILTIIVKVITLPLTLKSMISMRAMSKLQPEMAALKEKYKSEPQKMNAAVMELYKTHKVNPLSGCLPLLIQLPIFFALYKALLVSIELKGAPFFGWITDLSAKDPYFITPILMGISMFIQQKMTPTSADPVQQKVFLIMPVVFTFLFLNFPVGLVIYWLTNNILSIIQQYVINKRTS